MSRRNPSSPNHDDPEVSFFSAWEANSRLHISESRMGTSNQSAHSDGSIQTWPATSRGTTRATKTCMKHKLLFRQKLIHVWKKPKTHTWTKPLAHKLRRTPKNMYETRQVVSYRCVNLPQCSQTQLNFHPGCQCSSMALPVNPIAPMKDYPCLHIPSQNKENPQNNIPTSLLDTGCSHTFMRHSKKCVQPSLYTICWPAKRTTEKIDRLH